MVPIVRLVELYDLFLPELLSIKECLHGRSVTASFDLMCPLVVVMVQPGVQVRGAAQSDVADAVHGNLGAHGCKSLSGVMKLVL